MILKTIVLLLLTSGSLLAEDQDWNHYLRSKSIQCVMTPEGLKKQIHSQVDASVRQIEESLKAQHSDFQTDARDGDHVEQDLDHIEVGTFPKVRGFDFYALEKVSVVIRTFRFRVQTTVYTNDVSTPTAEQGLWLPLVVVNPDEKKACHLGRVSVSEDQKDFLPIVDLVYGDPGRVVATHLVQVIDISNDVEKPKEVEKAKEVEKPKDVGKAKEKDEDDEPRSRHRRERRHYRYHHRHRRFRESQDSAEPPAKHDRCSGDISAWQRALCAIQSK